jgi:hypothetical protein
LKVGGIELADWKPAFTRILNAPPERGDEGWEEERPETGKSCSLSPRERVRVRGKGASERQPA